MCVVLPATISTNPVAAHRTGSSAAPMSSAKGIKSASLSEKGIAALKARNASPVWKATAAPGRMEIGARVWMEIVVRAWTVTRAHGLTATAAATRKAAIASPSYPAVRQQTGNQFVHFPSQPKPSPVGGGFALLLLTD